MLRIGHAILHVFDFESGSTFFSERELDLDNRQTRSYVTRRLRRIRSSAESKHGTFAPESNFASGLKEYLAGQVPFVDFSVQIAQWFWEELRRAEDLEQCDLLVADFTDTGEMRASENADEDKVADAYESEGTRLFAAFIHEVDENGNEIARQDATLPNPTQKVDTYVLINADTLAIDFHDKERSVAGESRQIIPELFLQCSQEASSHEVIDEVTSIVEDLSEEYGLTPAVEVSRAKAALARHADKTLVARSSRTTPRWRSASRSAPASATCRRRCRCAAVRPTASRARIASAPTRALRLHSPRSSLSAQATSSSPTRRTAAFRL